MPTHPLAEIFDFPATNVSPDAERYRRNKLCPFNNRVPNCTNDKANDPLGVCSVYDGDEVFITCPIRFRQEWIIAEDAAAFFFAPGTTWTSLTEMHLNDRDGKSAGNVDVMLVAYDERGQITDFGALEVQAVYISGNVRRPFEHYMEDPVHRQEMNWIGQLNYPRPDYLSSSRKRLAPQWIFKGGIFNAWNKKTAVALNKGFFETLPELEMVDATEADIAWLVYDLRHDAAQNRYVLERHQTVYTCLGASWKRRGEMQAGPMQDFVEELQARLEHATY